MKARAKLFYCILCIFLFGCSESYSNSEENLTRQEKSVIKGTNFRGSSMASDKRGNLYVAYKEEGKIERIDIEGNRVVIAEDLKKPYAIAVDNSCGVYFIEEESMCLFYVNKKGSLVKIAENLESPTDVCVDMYGRVSVLSSISGDITIFKR